MCVLMRWNPSNNNGFTNVGYDGVALFATNHPLPGTNGDTFANTTSSAGENALTYANLTLAITKLSTQVDGRGIKIQAKADRLAVSTNLYFTALGVVHSSLVAGTSNLCELFVGYFTKGGDSTYDIGTLNNYTVEEVIKIGEYLEVPNHIVHKVPSDGLSGMSDEDKLGVKYDDIAKVIHGEEVAEEVKNQIMTLHKKAEHKFNTPVPQR